MSAPAAEVGGRLTARLAARVTARVTSRWRALPSWAQVLLVYALTRVFAFALVHRAGHFQPASLWTSARPGYLGMVDLWDGDWYRRIAETGYPASVPRDGAGDVLQNKWAFFPLYPFVVRAVMATTGLEWALAATSVALVCGAGAVVVMRSLVARVAGPDIAFWTVVLFCCFPSAPVLQLAYTESLAVLLLVAVLWCLQRRRYMEAVPLVVLLGVARPIGVPLAAVVAWHVVRLARATPPGRRGDVLARPLVLLLAAGIGAATWPAVAAAATGELRAYTDTMAAWRLSGDLVPVQPWFRMSQFVLGDVLGMVGLAVLVTGTVYWLSRPSARLIAGDLRAWCVAYLGYLLLVLDPSTSLPRYLLLMFPLGTLTVAVQRGRSYRLAVAAAFLAGQVVWVVWLWRFIPPTDWPP